MIFEIEATGKTIEKAVENALFELKAIREDVDIKILEQGGFFKKAKVLVSISEDARSKYLKKEENRNKVLAEEEQTAEEIVKEIIDEPKEVEVEIVEIKDDNKDVEIVSIKEEPKEKIDAENFIKGFINVCGCGNEVEKTISDGEIKFEIKGEKASDLIGYRGECLNALQYISNIIENDGKQTKTRVIIDIENYKSKREETLRALARRMAAKVLKTNKVVKLEPMNANDRRIIHTEVQNFEGLTTMSKGTEPNRYLLIMPKKD